jgi:diaminopimelate epimerase
MKLPFVKMNALKNDFVIFDARVRAIFLSADQIKKVCDRKNIGCDQLIIINNAINSDCIITIYNSDGSLSGACGNATRCVASLIMEENKSREIKIETSSGVLKCWVCNIDDKTISVEMGVPKFLPDFFFDDFTFHCLDIGNPHTVAFVDEIPDDKIFLEVSSEVEKNRNFPNKTNVEFAKIISDDLIEVRVFERGVGETMACGSGACAVGVFAIKNNLVKKNKVNIRFKGGELLIYWAGSQVVMTGNYEKIFYGEIDESFL